MDVRKKRTKFQGDERKNGQTLKSQAWIKLRVGLFNPLIHWSHRIKTTL